MQQKKNIFKNCWEEINYLKISGHVAQSCETTTPALTYEIKKKTGHIYREAHLGPKSSFFYY